MTAQPRIVEVRERVLKQNDLLARELRSTFRDAHVHVVSMVSSPGSGKTTLLEATLTILSRNRRVAALVGDLATENDALRLRRGLDELAAHDPQRALRVRDRARQSVARIAADFPGDPVTGQLAEGEAAEERFAASMTRFSRFRTVDDSIIPRLRRGGSPPVRV